MDPSLFTRVLSWDVLFSQVILRFRDVQSELWRVLKQGSDFSRWRHFNFCETRCLLQEIGLFHRPDLGYIQDRWRNRRRCRDVAAMARTWGSGGVTSSNSRDICGTKDCLDEETASILRLYEVYKVRVSLRGLLGLDSSSGSVFTFVRRLQMTLLNVRSTPQLSVQDIWTVLFWEPTELGKRNKLGRSKRRRAVVENIRTADGYMSAVRGQKRNASLTPICKQAILLIACLHLRSIIAFVSVNMRGRSFRYPNVSRWIIIYHGDVCLLN